MRWIDMALEHDVPAWALDLWRSRGTALVRLQRFHESLASAEREVALGPDDEESRVRLLLARYGHGRALLEAGRTEEALAVADISCRPVCTWIGGCSGVRSRL